MDKNFLEFGLSAWWILPALLLAAGLSYVLYTKRGLPWNKNQNLLLGILRFSAIFLILLLLLEPLIRQVLNETERPIIVVGVDNSASIASIHDQAKLKALVEQINELKTDLEDDRDYRIEVVAISDKEDSISFNAPVTDYSNFFREVENDYAGRHLSAVILATDGIFNRGASPAHRSYRYPVYTLGLGDTIPRRDVAIRDVRSNAVAYQGNEFPIKVRVVGEGYVDENFDLTISAGGQTIKGEKGKFQADGNEFIFFLTADSPGLKHYTLAISRLDGEMTYANNRHEVYVEVLQSKKQIRIAANAPHPDMRAIRSVLEETGNYEITLDIAGLKKETQEKTYDAQILFDGVAPVKGKSGLWTINSSETGQHLNSLPFIKVVTKGRPDKVIPGYNGEFSKFQLTNETDKLKRYPPLLVPFGDYQLSGPHEILFYQQVGSVVTNKPLIAVFDDGNQRHVVSLGSGIWQWRMQEAARNGDDPLFTEIIQKLVQYLSIHEEKKQFRVNRGLEVFTDGDVVFFNVEIYDDIFQSLEAQPYQIEITDENGAIQRYDYVFGSESKVARAISYQPGTYTYRATSTVGAETLTVRGEFLVNSLQLEQRALTADHEVLKLVSDKSGGAYFHFNEFEKMRENLLASDFSGIIHSDTTRKPFIHLLWVMLLIGGLLCAEWVLRKLWGAY